MKAIILNQECGGIDIVPIPQQIADKYLNDEDYPYNDTIYDYLRLEQGYGVFVRFEVIEDNEVCPIYDYSQNSEEPIYVIR